MEEVGHDMPDWQTAEWVNEWVVPVYTKFTASNKFDMVRDIGHMRDPLRYGPPGPQRDIHL